MGKVKIEKWESYCPECDGTKRILINNIISKGWAPICPKCSGVGRFTWIECAKGDAKELPRGKIIYNIKKESKGQWIYIGWRMEYENNNGESKN